MEFGSRIDSQFISVSASIAVAAYFAVKGFHERDDPNPRIACLDAADDLDLYNAEDNIPRSSFTARNYARKFHDYVYTNAQAARKLTLTKMIELDIELLREFVGHTWSFDEFNEQYRGKELDLCIRHSLAFLDVAVTFDLVGLPHYRPQWRGQDFTRVRITLENDNEHNEEAVRVDGCFGDANNFNWMIWASFKRTCQTLTIIWQAF